MENSPHPEIRKPLIGQIPRGRIVSMTWPKMKSKREGDREKKRWS